MGKNSVPATDEKGLAASLSWRHVPSSGPVLSVTQLRDGTIAGVATDNQLWTCATPTSAWVRVPNSGSVKVVTQLRDGTIAGVGTDNQLWTRATLTSRWINVPNSGSVLSVTQLRDGTIAGVGTDNQLWTRATLMSAWSRVPDDKAIKAVAQLGDGTIAGVGTDGALYTRPGLASPWTLVSASRAVIALAQLSDGTLLGVGTDHQLYLAEPMQGVSKPSTSAVVAAHADPTASTGDWEKALAERDEQIDALARRLADQELKQQAGDRALDALAKTVGAQAKQVAERARERAAGDHAVDTLAHGIGTLAKEISALATGQPAPAPARSPAATSPAAARQPLLFQQLMTPDWLAENAKPGTNVSFANEGAVFVVRHEGSWIYKRLLAVKLHDLMRDEVGEPALSQSLRKDSLVVAVEIAFDHHYGLGAAARGDPMHAVHVMLSDGRGALGFRIEGDVQRYAAAQKGPYLGARGTVAGETLQSYTLLDAGVERVVASAIFPQVFRILLKPREGWGACSSAIDSGHLHAVDYGTSLSFSSAQLVLALYSDDQTSRDEHRLCHIDLSVYKES